jgi:predicted kinase
MKAIITVGVSASGKSTWAKQQARKTGALISNRDDLRFALTGSCGWPEYDFDNTVEFLVTQLQRHTLHNNSTTYRKDVIIADTNLKLSKRSFLVDLCIGWGYEVEVKPFLITLEDAIGRDNNRHINSRVGRKVIEQQYKQWLEFYGEEAI